MNSCNTYIQMYKFIFRKTIQMFRLWRWIYSTSSLKSHYKLHKQQSLYEHENDDLSTFLSSYKKYDIINEHNNHEWDRYEQTYCGKFFMIV